MGYRIKAIDFRNFMGIRHVKADDLDAYLVVVAGANAQGKSSVLTDIWATLLGKKAFPAQPVRRDAATSENTIDIGAYRIHRKIKATGGEYLTLTDADGHPVDSAQTRLNALVGTVAFDPDGFVKMDEKKQAKVLRDLAGLTEKFAAIDAERAAAFAERTDVNRALKQDDLAIANFPPVRDFDGLPDEEVSIEKLTEEWEEASETISYNRIMRDGLKAYKKDAENATLQKDSAEREVVRLETLLDTARGTLKRRVGEEIEAIRQHSEAEKEIADLVDPDTASIKAKMESAGTINRKIRQRQERQAIAEQRAGNQRLCDQLNRKIERLDERKSALLESADYGVEGLDVRDDAVYLRGVPLSQASAAEQIKVRLTVGAKLNPELRVALVFDGSLLDDTAMNAVRDWAVANDFQVWIEVVGAGRNDNEIRIEDGSNYKVEKEVPGGLF